MAHISAALSNREFHKDRGGSSQRKESIMKDKCRWGKLTERAK